MTQILPTVAYDLADGGDDVEVCGADLDRGGTCDRPADDCPYHGGD